MIKDSQNGSSATVMNKQGLSPFGKMAERLNAPDLKSGGHVSDSWVRILLFPLIVFSHYI